MTRQCITVYYLDHMSHRSSLRTQPPPRSLNKTLYLNQQLRSSKRKRPCLVSSQQPSQGQLVSTNYPFLFCRELLVLPWIFFVSPWVFLFCRKLFWFCRELFGFAVNFFGFAVSYFVLPWTFLVLPWAILFCRELFWFCRELFGFAVSYLVLPWAVCFAVNFFGFAVNYFVLPWTICNCDDSYGPPCLGVRTKVQIVKWRY